MSTKRKEEVIAKLHEAAKRMTGREITSLKDQEQIFAAVNRYFHFRDKTLEEALSILGYQSRTTEQLVSAWKTHLHSKSSEGTKILLDAIKDRIPASTFLLSAVSDAASQETAFYLELAKLRLPDTMRGKLLEYRKEFEVEKKNLQDKWDKLLADNKIVNTSIEELSKQLVHTYKTGFQKIERDFSLIKAEAKVMIEGAKIYHGLDPTAPKIDEIVSSMVTTLNTFRTTSTELSNRFDQLYKSEETVTVIMFGNTRKSVKEFLEKTNLDKAQKDYNDAIKHGNDLIKSMLTYGQQEDAAAFFLKAIERTKVTLTEFTEAYNSFVDSFREIFIGPVGDRTVNDLIKKERWDFANQEYKNLNIQEELKKMYDDNREWVDVDLMGLTAEGKQKIDAVLKKERERLELALNHAGDAGILGALKNYLGLIKDLTFAKVKNL